MSSWSSHAYSFVQTFWWSTASTSPGLCPSFRLLSPTASPTYIPALRKCSQCRGHPQIASSLRALELYGENKAPLQLIQSTVAALHFPQLVCLTIDLLENENKDFRLLRTWSMPYLQALLIRCQKMDSADFEEPLLYGVLEKFGPTLTLLSLQCQHRYTNMPPNVLNRILELCPSLVGFVIDVSLGPWTLRVGQVAHSQISLIGLAHFTIAGASVPATTGRVYESILRLMSRAYFPSIIHVRVLAPEAVMILMNPTRMKEVSKGGLWLSAWRNHLLKLGTRFENCLGIDFLRVRRSDVTSGCQRYCVCSSRNTRRVLAFGLPYFFVI